jgi:hypothetical protein
MRVFGRVAVVVVPPMHSDPIEEGARDRQRAEKGQ